MINTAIYVVIFICFFLSGMAGLIYETVWVRKLTLIFGASVYSTSTVIAAFMAGLSLGSIYFGKLIDRYHKPLKLYAILEVCIAISALSVPFFIGMMETLYIPLYPYLQNHPYIFSLLRFAGSFLILLVPTFLMGGTLPILSKFIIPHFQQLGKNMGRLYAINTFGAVSGCLVGSFFLMPSFGISTTNLIAVGINLGVAGLIIMLSLVLAKGSLLVAATQRDVGSEGEALPALSKRLSTGVLVGFALSGFCALGYQVLWTRVFSATVGSSVYAFGLILSSFLIGIALGSLVIAQWIHRMKRLLLYFALIEITIGLYVLFTLPLFDQLPLIFMRFFKWTGQEFEKIQVVHFMLCFGMIFIPTFLFGAVFPIVSKMYANKVKTLGKSIGYLYGFNTIGSILGSFVAGFILIPLLGVQTPIKLFAVVNILIGIYLFCLMPTWSRRLKKVVIVSVVVISIVPLGFLRGWNNSLLYSGAYYYAHLFGPNGLEQNFKKTKVLFHKEGVHASVMVRDWGNNWLALYINGKGDASSGLSPLSDLATQYLLGHIPMLLHPNPKSAMVIGLGSGATLGVASLYPLREIDAIEISPTVVEASDYFRVSNFNVLKDKRVNLIVNDARTHILSSPKKYDVIISEPSNPWITGISNMFTQESYELIRKRLNPDGLVSQWFHYYRMSPRDFKVALKTFRSVFPYVTVWDIHHGTDRYIGDVVLIGSMKPFQMSRRLMKHKLKNRRVFANLAAMNKHTYSLLMDLLMMDELDIDEYTESVAINTDDRPILEFSAPKNMYASASSKHRIYKSMNFYKMFRHMY